MNRILNTLPLVCLLALPAAAEELVLDDLVVDGAACVGSGCASGEVFGETDFKIKQSSVRMVFEDTSTSAGVPTTDWELKANDVGAAGSEFFAIRNLDDDTAPFRIWGDALANTMVLSRTGSGAASEVAVGIGTRLPVYNLHINTPFTPVIQLERNASAGLVRSRWNITASGFEFNLTHVDNANQRPLRIHGDAPENSIYVSPKGDIGLGTNLPEEKLHIQTSEANTDAFALFDAAGTGSDAAFLLRQNGTVPTTWEFRNQEGSGRLNVGIAGGNTPFKIDDAANNNLLRLGLNGQNDVVSVTGRLLVNNTQLSVPDYVFGDDYALRPLSEVQAFIDANSHLPEVPSEAEIKANGVDMTAMQMTLLKKVEELTLYTLEQDATIAAQNARMDQMAAQISALLSASR